MRFRALLVVIVVLSGVIVTVSSATASTTPEVWVGAPFDGHWASSDGCPAAFPSYGCSEPQSHSVDYYTFDGTPRAQSWATDIGGPATGANAVPVGTQVRLYVAPQVTGTSIVTKVDKVGAACKAPNSAGQVVVIGVYSGATKIGTIAYAHVVPDAALPAPGQPINRWGAVIGTVGGGYTHGGSCWTGTHLHLEMGNTAANTYSCYNGGFHPGSPWGDPINKTNFVGFLGGDRATGPRQQCPPPSWSIVPTPTPTGAVSNGLGAISCPSVTSCFALGADSTESTNASYVEHWNGTTWSIVPLPGASGTNASALQDIACPTINICNAVGYGSSPTQHLIVEHWNGSKWSTVKPPNPIDATLSSISCPSATSCFAVGSQTPGKPLIERWNGTTWSVMPTPSTTNPSGANGSDLASVACAATTNCRAIGSYNAVTGPVSSLVEAWNGTKWTVAPAPKNSAELSSLSCPTATSCFAVGETLTFTADGIVTKTLAEHWNGASWATLQTVDPVATTSALAGIACLSASSCYAVGTTGSLNDILGATLIEHWNGSKWSRVPSANESSPTYDNWLYHVACPSMTTCIAVGDYSPDGLGTNVPFVEQGS